MARLLRSGPIAHIADHLPPPSQRRLFDALLCTPEERYGYLKLMKPETAGRYLLRRADPDMLAHALAQAGNEDLHGVPRPDVVVDRSSWLLRAGTTAAAKLDAPISRRARNAMKRAEKQLDEQFEHAGPSARAGAVRNLVGTCSFANTLEDAFRFAQTALAPQRFHALPRGERANALATLTEAISDAAYAAWQRLDDLSEGEEEHQEEEAHLTTLLVNGLSDTVPMLLNEARQLSPIPSEAARLVITSLMSALECATPNVDTQRAILDLIDTQLPYLQVADHGLALGRLAESLWLFGRPEDQRRMLNMVLQRAPGSARPEDWLAHSDAEGRWYILLGALNSLRLLDDNALHSETLDLLANQLAPHRLHAIPGSRLQELLVRTVELDVQADYAMRMLTTAVGALDALPGASLERPLRALARRAAGPLNDALAQQIREARLRLLPRLPLEMLSVDARPLEGLSTADEALILAAHTNAAAGDNPRRRASTFAFVAARVAARVRHEPDAAQTIDVMAHALPRDAAIAWAGQLESQLEEEALGLRLAPGPSEQGLGAATASVHRTVQALIEALRRPPG